MWYRLYIKLKHYRIFKSKNNTLLLDLLIKKSGTTASVVRIHTHGEKNYYCFKDLQLSKRKTILIIVLFTVQLSLKLQQGM